ncbi:hypothetical protein [Luteimonas sp. 3794]|uniref:hypothetical protein n=1 Tax=Luteimonas sp. 3794 TaxID=2817730 RepID=UPI002863013B|nr:hypothetical protein [Luteimonas sp. 3794]MDR6992443.1 hypothetical protein [Luteimonas sp. 3794]
MQQEFTVEVMEEPADFDTLLRGTRYRLCREGDKRAAHFRASAPAQTYDRFASYLDQAEAERESGNHDLAWSLLVRAVEIASFEQGKAEGVFLAETKPLSDHMSVSGKAGATKQAARKVKATREILDAVLERHASTPFASETELREAMRLAGRKTGYFVFNELSDGSYKTLRANPEVAPILDHLAGIVGGLNGPRHPVKRPRRDDLWRTVSIQTSGPSREPGSE